LAHGLGILATTKTRSDNLCNRRRSRTYLTALYSLLGKLLITLGCTTILLWLMVVNYETMIVYMLYVIGYTGVVIFQVSIEPTIPPSLPFPFQTPPTPILLSSWGIHTETASSYSQQFNRCFAKYVRAHVTSLYVCASLGLCVGCTLHAIPWTSSLLYIDVLAMNTAALGAAISSTVWVWVGFRPSDSPTTDVMSLTSDATGLWTQPLITAPPRRASGSPSHSDWKPLESKKTVLDTTSPAASIISQTLKRAGESPSDSTPSWQVDIALHAYKLWSTHNIVVSFVDRETFVDSGLRGCCSASRYDSRAKLEVLIGVFGASELRMSSWSSIQGRM
jgi:hypothetical protein